MRGTKHTRYSTMHALGTRSWQLEPWGYKISEPSYQTKTYGFGLVCWQTQWMGKWRGLFTYGHFHI